MSATDAHPFWVPEQAAWVEAIDLRPGTWLRTSAGTWTQTSAVDTRTVPDQRVHNLTIAEVHTYHVALGETNALVHNDNDGCDPTSPEALEQAYQLANTPQKLEHVIDPPKHGFEDLVERSGGREQALRRIIDSLADESDIPSSGRFEVDRLVDGATVTIRGAVVGGVPRLGTAFTRSEFNKN